MSNNSTELNGLLRELRHTTGRALSMSVKMSYYYYKKEPFAVLN